MSTLDNVLIAIHAIAGILWIVFGIMLALLLNGLSKRNDLSGDHKAIMKSVMRIRATGGIAIIFGIVLMAILASDGGLPSFSSLHGIVLLIGVILALLVYIGLNEGFVFRKILKLDSQNITPLRNMAAFSSVLTIVVLILMVIGSS